MSTIPRAPPCTPAVGTIPIGVLITNPQDPFQNIHDSFPNRTIELPAQITIDPFGAYEATSTNTKVSKLRSSLADFLGIGNQSAKSGSGHVSASQGELHYLLNHQAWFDAQCKNKDTRDWVFKRWSERHDIYLITSLLILTDAEFAITRTARKDKTHQLGLPILPGFAPLDLTGRAIVKNNTTTSIGGYHSRPGKSIFGLWYRKIKVRWLKSKDLDNSRLALSTTWEPLWHQRGEEKDPEAHEEEEEEEEDEDEDEDEDEEECGEGDLLDVELEPECGWGNEVECENDDDIFVKMDVKSEDRNNLPVTGSSYPEILRIKPKRKFGQDELGEGNKRPRLG